MEWNVNAKCGVFPRTEKRGRLRSPRLVASDLREYAHVIKEKAKNTLKIVTKRIIYGKDIRPRIISTNHIERLNLTCGKDNNRISKKTIGFSKRARGLYEQTILFFANYNYCKKHMSLENEGRTGKNRFYCPAKRAGLIDCVWSLDELLGSVLNLL